MSMPSKDQSPHSRLYIPLADSDEIRLLYLQPRDHSDTIAGMLMHVKLSEKPAYEALSYEWGKKEVKLIQLNGEKFQVRENLFNALSKLRHQFTPRFLWIDALCIDQNDLNERNHQVPQIVRIYSQAQSVIA
jgi:Heterokaryon incompatibility protein (HET)